MNNKFLSLKFLDLFRTLFLAMKIDYDIMRKILQIKLTMDQRRVPTIFSQNSKKKDGNQFLKSLGIYAIYGLALIPLVFLGENYIFQVSIIFGITMFILMTSMISDFSFVLLDVRDKVILNTKPMNVRTINAAKIIHIAIYLSLLTVAFIAIPSGFMIYVQGILYFLIFFIETILLGFFIVALTALVYMFILKFFNGEKLKDMINYVQILLSIGILVGYQIVIRIFDFVDFEYVYNFSWWHLFIPPMWFGAPFELFLHHNYSNEIIALSLLALIVPLIAILLYYRLMPSFERNLQKLMNESGTGTKKKWNLSTILEKWVCFGNEERLFFRFSSIMMSQEREFKLRVYPTIGMALIFPLIFLFNRLSTGTFSELKISKAYLTIYFCHIVIGMVVYMLKFSGNYKGAWIFQITPIKNQAAVYSATLKAFLVKLYIPIFLILSVVYISIFSFRILPDLAVAFVTAVLLALISFKLLNNGIYPFIEPFESAQQSGGGTFKTFLLMAVAGVFAGLHYFSMSIDFGVYIYLLILLIFTFVGWKWVFYSSR